MTDDRLRDPPNPEMAPAMPGVVQRVSTMPVVEKRHTVSLWFYLAGALAFLLGCYLLFMEDGVQARGTFPSSSPRTEIGPAEPLLMKRARLDVPPFDRLLTAAQTTTGALSVAPAGDAGAAAGGPRLLSSSFLEGLWREAEVAGVQRATFDRAFQGNTLLDTDILALNSNQAEFDRTPGDYVGMMVSVERIAVGRARLEQQAAILDAIEKRFGVDRTILLAIWGIETNFGLAKGDRSVIRSLATLASAEVRRAPFWRSELIAALTILEQNKMQAEKLLGSWAGAMGHTQFMPSTYLKHAVDFDGDGLRDVWSSVPDALASAAKYLQSAGWVAGRPWAREVVVPVDFDFALASPSASRSIAAWRVLGVRAQSGPLPANDETVAWQLILPAGAHGPAFLVSSNFEALLTYNRSYSYAIAVGTLGDRIGGSSGIQASWPVGDAPLTRDQRVEMQEILISLGFDTGGIDGVLGSKTREAIRTFQKGKRLPADGYPSPLLLARMRMDRRL